MTKERVGALYLAIVGGGVLFWFVNLVSRDARAGYAEGGWLRALEKAPETVRRFGLELSLDVVDLGVAVLALLAAGLGWWVWKLGKGIERRGEEHGSARWGRPGDLAGFANKDKRKNLMLTRTERINLDRAKRPECQRNLNVLCLGASGSGKSRNFIMPNLVNAQTSFLVTDPKGELLQETGARLREAGYRVRVLNLVDFGQSDQFNPMAYFRPGHEPEDVGLMVRNIMENTSVGERVGAGNDPFWEKAEAALLTALIAFVAATSPVPDRHLGTVIEMLGQMEATDEGKPSRVDELFTAAVKVGEETRFGSESELLTFAAANYRIYQQAAAKTAASIIVTAGVRLAPLHIPALRRLVSADTLRLDGVGFEKTALFMVISDTSKQFNWLASLVFTQFFQRSVFLADQQEDRRLPHQVLCLMDEFANIGRIPDFDVLAATLRSRGIGYVAVIQNIGQGEKLYREGWKAIVGNCDSVLFLGSADPDTRKYVSEALGKQTIQGMDSSVSRGRSGSSSQSRKSLGRELLTPDEVGRLSGDEALLMIRGLPPFRSKKLPPVATGEPYRHAPVKALS